MLLIGKRPMCGIAEILKYQENGDPTEEHSELIIMRDFMRCLGPEGDGV